MVTGASRGLGKEVCRQLGQKSDMTVIAGCRSISSKDAQQQKNIIYQRLDVDDDQSVANFVQSAINQFGTIHMLINNAGVYLDNNRDKKFTGLFDTDLELLKRTMETNFYGAYRMIKAIFPYMKQQRYGRIVNVSSGMGSLAKMELDESLRRDARNGSLYRMSKTALNALTRIVAAEGKEFNILANSVCPGWVRTDMGGDSAVRTVSEAAAGILWAATLPDDGPSGGFFRDGKTIPW